MENKLELLLNALIDNWWQPRWEEKIHSCKYYKEEKKFKADYTIAWMPQVLYRSIRELCSKESWLWQFVCENGYNQYKKEYRMWYTKYSMKAEYWDEWDYEYFLIESSLKDESELEDFLLSNIAT